jgi:hypothetical protein
MQDKGAMAERNPRHFDGDFFSGQRIGNSSTVVALTSPNHRRSGSCHVLASLTVTR